MPVIGQFMRENDGFIGHLMTLTLHQDIIIVPAEPSDAENAPDFRVHVLDSMNNETGAEIGAGWKRTGEKAGDYVALQIDDPAFVQPLRANLFHDDGIGHVLVWSRPSRHDKAD